MSLHHQPHNWLLIVQPRAKQVFDSLAPSIKRGIFRRLRELLMSETPYSLAFVEILKAKRFERLRKFRVGDYRVFFALESQEVTHLKHTYKGSLHLIDIRDRKEAY